MICHEARQWLGAEPGGDQATWPAELREHLGGCEQCQRYAREMLALEGPIRRALEVDLARFREPGRPLPAEILRDLSDSGAAPEKSPAAAQTLSRRGWAMAASVLLAVGLGAGLWALRSEPSLASAVVDHMSEETGSWGQTQQLGQSEIDAVLANSGVHVVATATPVVYASSCDFRGRQVPHLVVSTDRGPVTVMLLRHERISAPRDFDEAGYRGVLWPAPDGDGGIAVLARGGEGGNLRDRARTLTAQLRWPARAP